ncbi:hypothetical protein DV738_g3908, partial [Chaetothyriales sp. CBS 135597]
MVRTSVLNDALKSINNAEKAGKRQVMIRPSSKVIIKFLDVMQKHGYIGEYEEVDDHRSGKIVIQLNGRLNKTGVISPRYNVQLRDLEKWVVKLLPSRQFGYIVLTTSSGIMDHEEARRKHAPAASSGGKKQKKKWSKGKVKDKANHAVILDKATSDKLNKDVQSYRLITVAVLVDRLKINGSLARAALKDLEQKGVIRKVVSHSRGSIYTRAVAGSD